MDMRNVSKLSDHKINKKGKIIAPLNEAVGSILRLTSWNKERLPEYLWLALILSYYGRQEGFDRAGGVLFSISRIKPSLSRPKMSSIFQSESDVRNKIYEAICEQIEPIVLAPLTVLYREEEYADFNAFFYNPRLTIARRVGVLQKVIKDYLPPQSFEATDLRYLALCLDLFNRRIHLTQHMGPTAQALKEYPYTSHEEGKMACYRPIIRSLESADFEDKNEAFIDDFWRELGMITSCKPMCIKFDEDETKPMAYLNDTKDILEYLVLVNKERLLCDSKFEVIIGSVCYAHKVFSEVIENNLGNKILGRHAVRTLIEVFIILKYLLKKEKEKPDIWREYQYYGISKYKLILLKARENPSLTEHHLVIPLIEAIVNEKLWEEFIDIDLRYFEQQSIREKSIEVGEKELYDLCYDYDSSYVHGLWGSVRESSMLICDNPAHQYHSIPDSSSNQNLPSVQTGCVSMMKLILLLVDDLYQLPNWYIRKHYEDNNHENAE